MAYKGQVFGGIRLVLLYGAYSGKGIFKMKPFNRMRVNVKHQLAACQHRIALHIPERGTGEVGINIRSDGITAKHAGQLNREKYNC